MLLRFLGPRNVGMLAEGMTNTLYDELIYGFRKSGKITAQSVNGMYRQDAMPYVWWHAGMYI